MTRDIMKCPLHPKSKYAANTNNNYMRHMRAQYSEEIVTSNVSTKFTTIASDIDIPVTQPEYTR